MSKRTYVSVYFVQQCYGGPEEGGWWYYAGILVPNKSRSFSSRRGTRREVPNHVRGMQKWCDLMNEGEPELESVLSQGRYYVEVSNNPPLPYYPTERPYYS